jgi:3-oxoacyl-[acyl-carrier-protein] synthase II
MSTQDVVITGIGLLSCLGEGVDAHITPSAVSPDTTSFAPYCVHALRPDSDWSAHIPRKEQRQMEQWQRIGTYTAGLALSDAGLKDQESLTATMDMIVAAGGGERDEAVDTQILQAAHSHPNCEVLLNEKLTTELRPTLFLAQLSNLLAGNISIVHKVTGSSRTFMGEEGAGIAALQTAFARIKSGQSTHILVGGAFNAQHPDTLLSYELGGFLKKDGWSPLWQRGGKNGVITGSGGAFLVLESRDFAQARGARIYAQLSHIASGQSVRKNGDLENSIQEVLEASSVEDADMLISGASGALEATNAEKTALSHYKTLPIRSFTGLTGHMKEAQFPFAVALAALSVARNTPFKSTDAEFEKPYNGDVQDAIALTVGYHRSEGAAYVKRA